MPPGPFRVRGEVYAVGLDEPGPVRVLGVGELEREAAEAALKGWADSDMTLLSLAQRFEPLEVKDPVAEAAEELRRCARTLKCVRVACDEAESIRCL